MKKFLIYLSLLVMSLIPLANVYASDTGEVITNEASECAGFTYSLKFDPAPSGTQTKTGDGNTITVTATWWKSSGETIGFDWEASDRIGRVVVKAGSESSGGGTRTYGDWTPGHYSGSGVSLKRDPDGGDESNNYFGISHITFCWNDTQDATADADVGSCSDSGATTSTPVYLSVMGATMHVSGPGSYSKSLTNASETINGLATGNYSIYYDNFQAGYADPGDLPTSFKIEACTVGQAEASAQVQQCKEGDVTEPVYLSVTNAQMHVTGNGKDEWLDNESKTFLNWPIGTYSIDYDPDPGYTEPDGPYSFTIGVCDLGQAEASAQVQQCVEGDETEPVILSVSHAKMFVTGNGKDEELHNETKTFNDWPAGTYSLSYEADTGYTAPDGPSSFTIGVCETKENAFAEADPLACETGDVSTPVFLSVTGATMNVSGPGGYSTSLHNESKTIEGLDEGTYTLTYVMDSGYQDPGDLPASFFVGLCEVEYAEATALVEACGIDDGTEPVRLSVSHATMHVSGPDGYTYNLTNDSVILYGLEAGDYTITYTLETGYGDPGNLPEGFTVYPCEKGDGFVDLTLSVKCIYGDNIKHKWVVTNMNTFAVDFTWSVEATEGSYSDSGSATVPALGTYEFNTKYVAQKMSIEYSDEKATKNIALTDGICEKDEEPDLPAGGLGPSAFSLLTPAMIGVSGTTLAWIMLKRKTKKTK